MQQVFAELPFAQAVVFWLKVHEPPVVQASTFDYYQQYSAPLTDFFGLLPLNAIGIGQVRGYQRWRCSLCKGEEAQGELDLKSILYTSKYRHAAGTVRIRNEINCVLKPILREAGQWPGIVAMKFKHLPIPRDGSGIALSKEEQKQILEVAFSRKKWLLAAHCLRIQYRSGSTFGELKKLRRKDVDFKQGTMTIVEGAKNSGPRVRRVALVPSALESMHWIIKRWEKLGGKEPTDYLFPHRSGIKQARFDQHMTSTYRVWSTIKREWLRQHPEAEAKKNTRHYDTRVSAASLLLGNPALSLPTIEKALGWTPGSKMRKRYHRVELEDQREALNTLEAS